MSVIIKITINFIHMVEYDHTVHCLQLEPSKSMKMVLLETTSTSLLAILNLVLLSDFPMGVSQH